MTKLPKYLYHYTSIENLSLILKNKSIRFSRADMVNDLDEVLILDAPEIKKSTFISCWTASDKESIPLWSLYASRFMGVRLKLSSSMFMTNGMSGPYLKDDNFYITDLPLNFFAKRKLNTPCIPYIFGPKKVIYCTNTTVSVMNGSDIDISKIGTIKVKHWMFEKEHRYVIICNAFWHKQKDSFRFNEDIKKNPMEQKKIDIPLNQDILDNIVVTLGVNTSDSERCIVDALLCKYTNKGRIVDSKLKGKVKNL